MTLNAHTLSDSYETIFSEYQIRFSVAFIVLEIFGCKVTLFFKVFRFFFKFWLILAIFSQTLTPYS